MKSTQPEAGFTPASFRLYDPHDRPSVGEWVKLSESVAVKPAASRGPWKGQRAITLGLTALAALSALALTVARPGRQAAPAPAAVASEASPSYELEVLKVGETFDQKTKALLATVRIHSDEEVTPVEGEPIFRVSGSNARLLSIAGPEPSENGTVELTARLEPPAGKSNAVVPFTIRFLVAGELQERSGVATWSRATAARAEDAKKVVTVLKSAGKRVARSSKTKSEPARRQRPAPAKRPKKDAKAPRLAVGPAQEAPTPKTTVKPSQPAVGPDLLPPLTAEPAVTRGVAPEAPPASKPATSAPKHPPAKKESPPRQDKGGTSGGDKPAAPQVQPTETPRKSGEEKGHEGRD